MSGQNGLPVAANHALEGLMKALENAQDHANDHSNAVTELEQELALHDVAAPPPPPPITLDHGPTNVTAITALFDHNHDHWFS